MNESTEVILQSSLDTDVNLWQDEQFKAISNSAFGFDVRLSIEEIAYLSSEHSFSQEEILAVAKVFKYLENRHRDTVVQTLLKLSRIPQKEPKTFENFNFARMQGKDEKALRQLPTLADLYARKNIAFIGPEGIGKTHLAQAYGNRCCLLGYKSDYLKTSELKAKLEKALDENKAEKVVNFLVKPSCLIIDEVGRCKFDKDCTNLFFDIVDRRYEKEGPNTLILTTNSTPNEWGTYFAGDGTLLCALDRLFDRASVFMMKGTSYRGKECETFSVEAAASVVKGLL